MTKLVISDMVGNITFSKHCHRVTVTRKISGKLKTAFSCVWENSRIQRIKRDFHPNLLIVF